MECEAREMIRQKINPVRTCIVWVVGHYANACGAVYEIVTAGRG
jgi:hypothetical protein